MKLKTQKLLARVEKIHDFDDGFVRGEGGDRLRTTCNCRRCGLAWDHVTVNRVVVDSFHALDGSAINLITAAKECK